MKNRFHILIILIVPAALVVLIAGAIILWPKIFDGKKTIFVPRLIRDSQTGAIIPSPTERIKTDLGQVMAELASNQANQWGIMQTILQKLIEEVPSIETSTSTFE